MRRSSVRFRQAALPRPGAPSPWDGRSSGHGHPCDAPRVVPVELRVEPDEEFEECALLCVDGAVSGTPHRFVLDSGSPTTQIADPGALIPPSGVGEDTAEGLFGRAPAERVVLSDLTVPGLTAGRRTVA